MEKNFELCVPKRGSNRAYRIQVEITYQSANVIRFTVRGGNRYFKAEKWLFRKSHQWKFGDRNFNFDDKRKKQDNWSMNQILWAIDAYLKQG